MKHVKLVNLFLLLVACAQTPTPEPQTTVVTRTITTTPQIVIATPTPEPTNTITVTPIPIATPTVTPTPQPQWTTIKGGENLLVNPSWQYIRGAQVTDGKLIISATDTFVTPINLENFLAIDGDFGISAKIETKTRDTGAISLFGALPQGDWWQGVKRMDVALNSGRAFVNIYTGAEQKQSYSQSYRISGSSGIVQLEVRKVGDRLLVFANGSQLDSIPDVRGQGLFEKGRVYVGANVAPQNQLTIYNISVTALQGQQGNIKIVSPEIPQVTDPTAPTTVGNKRPVLRSMIIDPARTKSMSISPLIWGTNYYDENWSKAAIDFARNLNITVLRFGGNDVDRRQKTTTQIDRFIATSRASNAEPLLQVRLLHSTPEEAAAMVRYVNVERKYDVKYWIIGNEPDDWNKRGWGPYTIEQFNKDWRAFYDAMKQVDPSIILVGPEVACRTSLGDSRDWLTPFLKSNGDVVDVVSCHWYPFDGSETRPAVLLGAPDSFSVWLQQAKSYVRNLTRRDIPFAVTEANLAWEDPRPGFEKPNSFFASLFLADLLGVVAQNKLYMFNFFPHYGNGILSMVDRETDQVGATYYAMQAYSDFEGTLVTTASRSDSVKVYASKSSDGSRENIVLVNKSADAREFDLIMRLYPDANQVGADFESPLKYRVRLDGYSFASLSFHGNSQFKQGTMYSKRVFDSSNPPENLNIILQP